MRNLLLIAAPLLACTVLLACATPGPVIPPGPPEECTVTKVVDGDTLAVSCLPERVRLLLVDAPEVEHDTGTPAPAPAECYGAEATRYLESRVPPGTAVRLEPGIVDRDRFGRYLRYVFLGGELLNVTLVREGYAVRFRSAEDRRFEREIAAAEDAARRANRGLWGTCPGTR